MFTAMIVDDENVIRKSLRKMIKDTGLPVEVICEAKNASEALSCVNQFLPDIVLTDMKMPESDGIMLMDQINLNYNHIKVIVISGYSDFKYMKKAISINAADYLLKPVTLQDLSTTLSKVINSIEEENQNQLYKIEMLSSTRRKKEIFLQNLCSSRISNPTDMELEAEKFKIPLLLDSYYVLIFAFTNLHNIADKKFCSNIELLINNIEEIFYSYIEDNDIGYVFKTDDRTKICILLGSTNQKDINNLFKNITWEINNQLKIDIIAGVSLPFSELSIIEQAFKQALEALFNNPLNITNSCSSYTKSTEKSKSHRICNEDIKILSRAIISKNSSEIKKCFLKIIKTVKLNEAICLHDIHKLYLLLIIETKSALGTLKITNIDSLNSYLDIQNIKHIISFPQFFENLKMISQKITKIIESEKSSDMSDVIKDVESYIQEHYSEDISLVDIACKYHFEPTYFSKMFKSVMNVGFIEYLVSLRLEKACDYLINSTLKVTDISDMVGYENPRYFSQIFKKFTGLTPTKYRCLHTKDL